MRYWTNYKVYWGVKATSRGEGSYGVFKKDLNNSLGDIKEVVDKFQLLLSRIVNEVLIK